MAVCASLSISLDGYYTGPAPNASRPLGKGGEPLHGWFAHDVADRDQLSVEDVIREELERLGAMVMGRDSYEHAQAAWGPHPPFEVPLFVLTHQVLDDDVREGTTFHFVTDGFDAALKRAKVAAGDKDVGLHGGGAIQQGIRSGTLDELGVHVVPLLLGSGRRLFKDLGAEALRLEQIRVAEGNGVAHIKYRLRQKTRNKIEGPPQR